MSKPLFSIWISLVLVPCLFFISSQAQNSSPSTTKTHILGIMYRVNNYQKGIAGDSEGRNWKTGTWYTGVMAFYKATGDSTLLQQAISWAQNNEWKVGNEWIYPANRLTCVQTYLEIFRIRHDSTMIRDAVDYMNSQITRTEPAYLSGWDYVDALYVGAPAYAILGNITGQKKYYDFMNRVFWEVADQLLDEDENLFYRDSEARFIEKSKNGKKVIWSRGNGWAIASLPRILENMPDEAPAQKKYTELLGKMAASLANCQGQDGLWRCNLADADEFPVPETSGTAFFTYALAWGINRGILDSVRYTPVVLKAWDGLCKAVNEEGKVCWGQSVARGPGTVSEEDSGEYVSGAFLLAGSEMFQLLSRE